MTKITVHPKAHQDPDHIKRLEAEFFLPGEKVKLHQPDTKFHDEKPSDQEARAKLDGRELTIKKTRLEESGVLNYTFEEVDGIFNAKAFINPEGCEHRYGTLITRNGQTWLVALTEDFENPAADGQPLLIDAEMPRSARHCFGINDKEHTVDGYLSSHQDEPATGEYYIIPQGNNHWQLANSPWMSSSGANEIKVAEQAIATYLEQNQDNDEQEHACEDPVRMN